MGIGKEGNANCFRRWIHFAKILFGQYLEKIHVRIEQYRVKLSLPMATRELAITHRNNSEGTAS